MITAEPRAGHGESLCPYISRVDCRSPTIPPTSNQATSQTCPAAD
ncbi:hypothetical protein [Microcoleus sp. herbarium14]